MKLDEARLLAYVKAMETSAEYRTVMDRVSAERLHVRARIRKRERTRRMWSMDGLPLSRCFMRGPKWRRYFNVTERPIAEIDPARASLHRPGRKLLIFSLEDDIRELSVCLGDEIRPGIFAEWSESNDLIIGTGGSGSAEVPRTRSVAIQRVLP